MNTDSNRFMPPVPRDRETPTLSEIIPFRSKNINIRRSKVLLPLLVVALAAVAMLGGRTHLQYIDLLCYLSVSILFLAIYTYSGMRKGWLWYIVPAIISYFLVRDELWLYALVFRKLLPGDTGTLDGATDFWLTFRTYFFGAGLCEEALKATPVLLALAAAYLANRRRRSPIADPRGDGWTASVLRNLALRGPLDGLLMGYAAGAAFIIHETLGKYIPHYMGEALDRTNDVADAIVTGLELVIPRALGGAAGHMAFSRHLWLFHRPVCPLPTKGSDSYPTRLSPGCGSACVLGLDRRLAVPLCMVRARVDCDRSYLRCLPAQGEAA